MNELFIGLLSGTSLDAIDAALVDFSAPQPQILHTVNYPIPNTVKQASLSLTQGDPKQSSLYECNQLDKQFGHLFAQAVLQLLSESGVKPEQVQGIGSHGQTIFHFPELQYPFSTQIGDPNTIAHETRITTVADFRRRDIAAGGQGAPLAPAFHNAFFHSTTENRAVINIGGLSNVTILPKAEHAKIYGFDTGPGNCLLDQWIEKHCGEPYDNDGAFAQSGTVDNALLQLCLSDPYFAKAPPKSTGREFFHLAWLERYLQTLPRITPNDVQATLAALTTQSIAQAIPADTQSVFICGGGARNTHLLTLLAQQLPHCTVQNTEALGIHADWVESLLFAWLAKQTLAGKPGNCPTATGAKSPVILGGIFTA